MKKELPIQLVETRGEKDIFLKEGGGSDKIPSWVTSEAINYNASILRENFKIFETLWDHKIEENQTLPLLTIATLHEKATAKSYRANARELFDLKKKRNIIGVSSPRDLIIKIDSKEDLLKIASNYNESNLSRLNKVKKFGIAAIVDISLYKPEIEDDLIGHELKVRLIDYLDPHYNELSERLFLKKCKENGLKVKKVNYAKNMRMFCIESINENNIIEKIITMDGIISVKKMPFIELSISPEPENTNINVKIPKDDETYPLVGILDSGIADIPHLTPWLMEENNNIADFAEEDINLRHGTAVAGIINYGDELANSSWTNCSPSKIVSCIINTDSDIVKVSEIEMIEHIRTSVENHPEIKIWNLSQGSTIEVQDTLFSDFGIALDNIQKEYNIIICKSAGNKMKEFPNQERITQGADSVLSLVVGSIAHEYIKEGDSPIGHRSPFSRKGPGPEFLIKPDLVHYGGNTHSKIHSFTEVGYECAILSGTSFSTPRITSLAANLAHRINRTFDPLLIKALLVHSASYPVSTFNNRSLLYELGFGMPSDLNDILHNDPNEFTMIWNTDFSQGDLQIQDIPFPPSMVGTDGLFYGEITVTVVTDPILKPEEGSEYCQSDVEVRLQTYDGINYIPLNAVGISPFYRNSDRLINPQNILAKDLYSKKSWESSDWRERTLIETSFKYQPIKKYHVNLENVKPAARALWLSPDRKWGLTIKSLYRDAVIVDRDYDGVIDTTRAVTIITIKDPYRKGVAYSECFASLETNNFVHSNLEIRQRVDIANDEV